MAMEYSMHIHVGVSQHTLSGRAERVHAGGWWVIGAYVGTMGGQIDGVWHRNVW